MVLRPQPGPQTDFLASPADVVIYGGAAGGGKSFGLLLEPLRNIDVPDFQAVIFRRTLAQAKKPGSIWDTSQKIYRYAGGRSKQQPLQWTFPAGATVTVDQLQYDDTVRDHDGAQYAFIGFDQLESFTRAQFQYMGSRARSTSGVRPYIRATCNPEPDSWLLELIGWWIDEAGDPIKARSGVIRFYVVNNEEFVTADTREELLSAFPELDPKSFTFIHADLEDNPELTRKDPGYRGNILSLPEHERRRLMGNWKIRRQGGLFYDKYWRRCASSEVPQLVKVCVGVDPSGGNEDGNDAQGIVVAGLGDDGMVYILEDATCCLSPAAWGGRAIEQFNRWSASAVVAEVNYGGKMVEDVIKNAASKRGQTVVYRDVNATRGKAVRAEPIAGLYEEGMVIHAGPAGNFRMLENECVGFDPLKKKKSPNRMDALVWAVTWLLADNSTGVLDFYRTQVAGLDKEAQERIAKRLAAIRETLKPKGKP